KADLQQPIDISIPLEPGDNKVNCFYAPPVEIWPVVAGDFVGSTEEGGLLNFKNVKLNPHGNGTHTECVGHIAKEKYTINRCLKQFHQIAKLVTIEPKVLSNGDRIIFWEQLEKVVSASEVSALIVRTLPNDTSKLSRNYSGINPPYFHFDTIRYLVECGVDHLLTDLPSVDKEQDGGRLLAHKAFWLYPRNVRHWATITELIYVPEEVKDGMYLLNMQITSLELDASPSKPVIYRIQE
ncbi:MAG: cyclase family protein, partial [Bacteroidetes bacterium]